MFKIIQHYEKGLLFVLGKFSNVLEPGLNFVPPLVSRVEKVDIRIQTIVLPKQEYITKDRKRLNAKVTVYYQIKNPIDAYFKVKDIKEEVQKISMDIIEYKIRQIRYNDIIRKKDQRPKLEYTK